MDLQNSKALAVPKIQQAIESLTDDDMRAVVDKIENGMMSGTTQHNYGGYMSALSNFKTTDAVMLFIIGNAMVACGGNKAGIESAIRIVGNC